MAASARRIAAAHSASATRPLEKARTRRSGCSVAGDPPLLAGSAEVAEHRSARARSTPGPRRRSRRAGAGAPVAAAGRPGRRGRRRRPAARRASSPAAAAPPRTARRRPAPGSGTGSRGRRRGPRRSSPASRMDSLMSASASSGSPWKVAEPAADAERPGPFGGRPRERPDRLVEPVPALPAWPGDLPVGVQPDRQRTPGATARPGPPPPPPRRRCRRARARARRGCSRARARSRRNRPRWSSARNRSSKSARHGQVPVGQPVEEPRLLAAPRRARLARRTRAACRAAGTGSRVRDGRASPPTCRPGRSARGRPRRAAASASAHTSSAAAMSNVPANTDSRRHSACSADVHSA